MGKPRVLIVDDRRDSTDSLAMLLRVRGHEVYTAYDGEEGVREAAARKPHVVLLDIEMPKLDGYEACRRIRELSGGENVLLIALTGWSEEDAERRILAAGFNEHFVKPVDLPALMKLLGSVSA